MQAYAYLPFGGGNRLCLGMNLAYLELKIFIAVLLKEYDYGIIGKVSEVKIPFRRPEMNINLFKL